MFCGAVSYAPEETASSRMSSLLTLMFSASNVNEPVSPGMIEGSAKYAESRTRNRGNSPFLVKILTIDLKPAMNIATTPRNVP